MSSTKPILSPTAGSPRARDRFLLFALAAGSLAFMAPSARLWLQPRMTLTRYEFDYFLGAFHPREIGLDFAVIQAGHVIHLLGFLSIGALFAYFVRRLLEEPVSVPLPRVKAITAILAFVWTLGLPWVSPDIFVYIATGWLDCHYGLSPYWHSISEVPGFEADGMFRNVHPRFLTAFSGYGTIFQMGARVIACASGGSEKVALLIYKVLNLIVHAGCAVLVLRLSSPARRGANLFFFSCNPLILFSILACAHNDHPMNLAVLAAFLFRDRGRPALAGLALAVAVSIKYVPILLVPLFAVDLLLSERTAPLGNRLLRVARLTAPFLLGAALMQIAYPDSIRRLFFTVTRGIGGPRESLHFLFPWLSAVFPRVVMPERTMLIAAFMAAYAAGLLIFMWRARQDGRFRLAEATVWVLLVYFIVLNETNQEWYLTWFVGPLTLIGSPAARLFGLRISWFFLPLVVFTINQSVLVYLVSNLLLYVLLVGLSVPLLVQFLRRSTGDGETPLDVSEA